MITVPKKDGKRLVALNGDKLGLIAGSVVGLAVMAVCFYWQKVDGITVAVRVGWAFVIAYGVTFFFVRLLLRITLFEFVASKTRGPVGLRGKRGSDASEESDEPPEADAE